MPLFTDAASNDAATVAAGGGLGLLGSAVVVLSAEMKTRHAVAVLMFSLVLGPVTTWVVLWLRPASPPLAVVAGIAAGFAAFWALPTCKMLAELAARLLGRKGERVLNTMLGDPSKDQAKDPPATG